MEEFKKNVVNMSDLFKTQFHSNMYSTLILQCMIIICC